MGQMRTTWADRVTILAFAAVGCILFLAIGQVTLLELSWPRLAAYLDKVLDRSVAVARAGIDTIAVIDRSGAEICSASDLGNMRYELFLNEYLSDIGRTVGNRILCSAGWGQLSNPVALPEPIRRQTSGTELWANARSPLDPRLVVDMARRGSVIVFTSPSAFKPFEGSDGTLAALVVTRDGRHVFRTFGDTRGLSARLTAAQPGFEFGPRITAVSCAGTLDICVVAALSNINILRQPAPIWFGIGAAGAVTAGSIGMVLAQRRRALASLPQQIRRAVSLGRLTMAYQPLVRLSDRRMVGVEALARLTDDRGRPIPPDIFIAIAEEKGFIGVVTRKVISLTRTQMRARLTGDEAFDVHINFAVTDLLDDRLLTYLDGEVSRLGISPARVVIELTERSTAEHDRLREAVETLRRRGYKFFIDDFGTGYSNLAYLARLPINGIKMDKMFTKAIGKAAASSAIVDTICATARSLNVELVAEGVEEPEQAARILELFPKAVGQGWLFGKPVPAEHL
ncbi:EAL domain-containing protein [Xanthobacter agilis]|uniref:EAL domain-containing protein n=1 Tax=Xanthobacter agilis TaxID=47492 RepID=UPI00372B8427